jgi:ADP-ribose pyrophosphatase
MPSGDDPAVRLLAAVERFRSPRFALAEETFATPDGEVVRPVVHHPGAVAILAQPTPETVLLVRQFRYPIRAWTLEIPAGTRTPGEPAEATAERELAEETGYRAAALVEVMRFHPAVGVSDEEMVLFRATGLVRGASAPEPGELVRAETVALAELPRMLAAGMRFDAKTLIAFALLGVDLGAAR